MSLRAVVVVPAKDEQEHIGACVRALAAQEGVRRDAYRLLVVLNQCRDGTAREAAAAARAAGLRLTFLAGPGGGPGPARRTGMDLAATMLGPRGLIATTDADTVVAPDWLLRQLEAVEAGADAVGGDVEVDETGLHPFVLEHRRRRAVERLAAVHAHTPHAEHHHFAGASMSLTAAAYLRLGGIPPLAALEDEALERLLRDRGFRVERLRRVRVRTSGRLRGRAPAGLAHDLAAATALATAAAPDMSAA